MYDPLGTSTFDRPLNTYWPPAPHYVVRRSEAVSDEIDLNRNVTCTCKHRITDRGLADLVELPNLEYLSHRNTELTDEGLELLPTTTDQPAAALLKDLKQIQGTLTVDGGYAARDLDS
ncbi:MAG: hypothetical protein R3C56_09260 [Pirellulaceae bacterium]|jgi:hypothetical protein